MLFNNILITSSILFGLAIIIKFNKLEIIDNKNNKKNQDNLDKIVKFDKSTSTSDIKDINDIENINDIEHINYNNAEIQTEISLDKNENFFIKETTNNSKYKWYDIISSTKLY